MRPIIFSCMLALLAPVLYAHDQDGAHEHQVVPESEREIARQLQAEGPQKNRGIRSVKALGAQALRGELDAPDERRLRARELTIAPGGKVAVHQHEGRPGLAYILEGQIVEHRNDRDSPVTRRAGDVSFEKTGVVHWWENTAEAPVRALVVDIVPLEQARGD